MLELLQSIDFTPEGHTGALALMLSGITVVLIHVFGLNELIDKWLGVDDDEEL